MSTPMNTDDLQYSPEIDIEAQDSDLFSEQSQHQEQHQQHQQQQYVPTSTSATTATTTASNSTSHHAYYTNPITTTPMLPGLQGFPDFGQSFPSFTIPETKPATPIVVNPHHPQTLNSAYKVSVYLRDREKENHVLTIVLPPGKEACHTSNSFYTYVEQKAQDELQQVFPYNIMWAAGFRFKLSRTEISYNSSTTKIHRFRLPVTAAAKENLPMPKLYMEPPQQPTVEIRMTSHFEVNQPAMTKFSMTTEEKNLLREFINNLKKSGPSITSSPITTTAPPSTDVSTPTPAPKLPSTSQPPPAAPHKPVAQRLGAKVNPRKKPYNKSSGDVPYRQPQPKWQKQNHHHHQQQQQHRHAHQYFTEQPQSSQVSYEEEYRPEFV